jgi:D-3-phosphoglycerate dehydrogenase
MSKHKVAVVSRGYESYDTEREILRAVDAELVLAPRDCLTEDEVIATAAEADAILVREAPVSARVIDALPRCRAIVRYGVGVDNIDLEHARQRRIYVANVPGYGTEEVSDHAAALLLACIRLEFMHPVSGTGLVIDAEPGVEFTALLQRLGWPPDSSVADRSVSSSSP